MSIILKDINDEEMDISNINSQDILINSSNLDNMSQNLLINDTNSDNISFSDKYSYKSFLFNDTMGDKIIPKKLILLYILMIKIFLKKRKLKKMYHLYQKFIKVKIN